MHKALFVAALTFIGCGSASSGPDGGTPAAPQGSGSMSGTVEGQSLAPKDVLAVSVQGATNIFITDVTGYCSAINDGHKLKSGTALVLILGQTDSSGASVAITPGTFPITDFPTGNTAATAELVKTDATCTNTVNESGATAVSGSVTVSAVSGSSVDGSYDLTMGSNDHVTGSFSAATCSYTAPASTSCP
jgi:hypothetical protein